MSNSERLEALIKAAQGWAESGIPVFPVKEDKAPLTVHGFHDAVSSPKEVRTLFEFYGEAAWGIGGRMGDGIFAVDVDLYKSNDVKTWFNARIEDGSLPETRTHQTKSGGLHLIYEGTVPDCKPVNGVEVKSDGGYIVLPGSPNYKVLKEGVAQAPTRLLETIRYASVASRGSTLAQLEAQVMSGADFHNSLAQISAKLASQGKDHIEIQGHLIRLLKASTASDPGHERHARWRTVMADKGGELSRLASSAYRKFNDDAVNDEFGELDDISELTQVDSRVFASHKDTSIPTTDFSTDTWPFEGQGYFADTDHDLSSVNFTMYPIYTENETVVVFAEPKTGKTALCLTTALHIACGMDLGALKVREGGPVLYYALEGAHAIRLRISSWKKVMRERGVDLPVRIPLFTIERSTNFLKEESRRAAAAQIIAANEYSLKFGAPLKAIFIDTLTRAMSGGDQNSVEDTSHLFELVSLVREGGVTATIVFVHHKSRAGNVRGSSNIEAEPDMLLDVSKKGEVVRMKIARARSIEDGATFSFNISSVDLGTTKQGHPLHGMFVEPVDNTDDVAGDANYHDIAETRERRRVITQLGKGGYVTAVDVVAGWHKIGVIKGRTIRGTTEIPPPLSMAHVKEALVKVAEDVGGSVYGDYLIRPQYEGNDVVGFKVLVAS